VTVLYHVKGQRSADPSKAKRRQRLARMGFDPSHTIAIATGLDRWVATIFTVLVRSAIIMGSAPGMLPVG
jgi:hypothetical protein